MCIVTGCSVIMKIFQLHVLRLCGILTVVDLWHFLIPTITVLCYIPFAYVEETCLTMAVVLKYALRLDCDKACSCAARKVSCICVWHSEG
jgi:hypothetical protein